MKNADMPIHPVTENITTSGGEWVVGLTKREHFAGLAMQAMLSAIPPDEMIGYDEVAYDAIRSADALLGRLEFTK